MSLDTWSREDIRNVILAANAASGESLDLAGGQRAAVAPDVYQAGYEAALVAVATAFGIPLSSHGRLRSPGVAIPGGRLAVSYRAERSLDRLLRAREEF